MSEDIKTVLNEAVNESREILWAITEIERRQANLVRTLKFLEVHGPSELEKIADE